MRKNYSRQREAIKSAVKSLYHPTAEELRDYLHEQGCDASLSTIYRNLNELSEEGEILSIHLPDGKQSFDGNPTQHHHAVCRKCGKIIDIHMAIPSLSIPSFQIDKVNVVIEGICETCES